MDRIFFTLFFFLLTLNVYAQQSSIVDNAKLIDYYQSQHYAEAADYLKNTYHEPVTNMQALSQLAYSSLMSGRLTDADSYYQRIYNLDSSNKAALYNLASINLRRGNTIKANYYFKHIVATDTTNFMVYKQLAKLCLGRNDISSYISYLQRANKLNAADADVASDLSDMYVTLKLLPQAEKVLNTAIAIDSSDISLLQSLIKLTYAQKKWNETLKACNHLLQLGDHSNKTITKMGEAYYHLQNYTCGTETLMSIDDNLQTETSCYFVAMCYKKLKDNRMAIKYLLKTIDESISPDITTYYGELGGVYGTTKQFKKSLAAYQRSLTFNPEPLIYYSLAGLYDEMNNKANAVRYYKKYLATHPAAHQLTYITYAKSRLMQLSH